MMLQGYACTENTDLERPAPRQDASQRLLLPLVEISPLSTVQMKVSDAIWTMPTLPLKMK
eukprot:1153992-Pelagomonas_calceolata.AAC.1